MKTLFQQVRNYLRMIKFSHSLFALPFAGVAVIEILYWHFWKHKTVVWSETEIAGKIAGIVICMVSLRSAAMGFNRIVDSEFDKLNPRTAGREIPKGIIKKKNAWIFVIISALIFVASAFLINPLAGYLSPLAVLVTFFYSYTKRFTYLCHFLLGFAIGLAPVAVSIALISSVTLPVILLSLALMFYIAGFDIIYACQDYEFDKAMKLYSLPSKFGIAAALTVAKWSHVLSFLFLVLFAMISQLNLIFYLTVLAVGMLFIYEHYLVRGGNLQNIPFAFFHVNSTISVVLFTGLLLDRLVYS